MAGIKPLTSVREPIYGWCCYDCGNTNEEQGFEGIEYLKGQGIEDVECNKCGSLHTGYGMIGLKT